MIQAMWRMVREPRIISVLYFFIYLAFLAGGLSALIDPPSSIAGSIGSFSMYGLAGMLTFGGLIGAPSALVGIWWVEKLAVISVGMSAFIYGGIITALHLSSEGNRLLQLSFVVVVFLMQIVRWHRVRIRPYDPDRHF